GEANVIPGTHALIQDQVVYHDLALVITDEQHRFGVRQRESLAQKGKQVRVLVMSATPIPRTLAISLDGELHISVLDEL
ncbi:DEAD/DEAH box helicase, partial [Escherichia coli]